jgi:hypothetical protein
LVHFSALRLRIRSPVSPKGFPAPDSRSTVLPVACRFQAIQVLVRLLTRRWPLPGPGRTGDVTHRRDDGQSPAGQLDRGMKPHSRRCPGHNRNVSHARDSTGLDISLEAC